MLKVVLVLMMSAWAPAQIYTVTSYCPCKICCGKYGWGYTTASGHRIQTGDKFVAAPRHIAYGTQLIVPGYSSKPVKVLDRGGAIKGNRLDVYYPTHKQALQWGKRKLDVITVCDTDKAPAKPAWKKPAPKKPAVKPAPKKPYTPKKPYVKPAPKKTYPKKGSEA